MTDPHTNQKKRKKDDFLMQGMILALAMVMTKVIGALYRIPLTNILGDEGNGFYGYAFEVYAFALMLSSLSLPTAVSKLVSARMAMRQRRNAFRVFLGSLGFSVIVGVLASLIVFFGADMIAANLMKSPLSAYALRVLAVGLFVVALLGVLRGYFQGLGTMMPTAVSQIIEQVVNAVVSIAGASVLFKDRNRGRRETKRRTARSCIWCAGGTLGNRCRSCFCTAVLLFSFFIYRK